MLPGTCPSLSLPVKMPVMASMTLRVSELPERGYDAIAVRRWAAVSAFRYLGFKIGQIPSEAGSTVNAPCLWPNMHVAENSSPQSSMLL